jgi:hypothetical protein
MTSLKTYFSGALLSACIIACFIASSCGPPNPEGPICDPLTGPIGPSGTSGTSGSSALNLGLKGSI